MSRIYHFAESTARVSKTTSAFTTVVALTLSARSSTPYFIFCSFDMDNNSGTVGAHARLRHITDGSTVCQWRFESKEPSSPIDKYPIAGFWRWPGTAGTNGQTFSLEYEAINSNTVGVSNSRIFAISEDTGDAYISQEGTIAVATTTTTAVSSIAFTPATQGDYLIFASNENKVGSGSVGGMVGCIATATSFGTAGNHAKETLDFLGFFAVAKQNFEAETETIQIFAKSSGAATNFDCRRNRIAVMRVDTFATAYYSDGKTRSTGTTIPYAAHSSAVFTPAAADHVTFGSFALDGSSNTVSVKGRGSRGATAVALCSAEVEPNIASVAQSYGYIELNTFSAASTTIRLERSVETSTITVGMSEGRIIVLNLTTVAGAVDISSPSLTMTMGGFAPDIVAGKNIFPDLGTFQFSTNTVSKQSVEILPPTIPIVLSGFTPALIVDVPVNLLSMTGLLQTPTVATVASGIVTAVDIQPPGGAFTLVSLDPTIAAGKNIQAPLGSIILSGFAPNVVAGKNIQPPSGEMIFQGQVPTVVAGKNILSPSGTITMSLIAPDIVAGKNIQPPSLTMVMGGLAPTIVQDQIVSAPTGTIIMQGHAPTLPSDIVISVDEFFMLMEGFAASIPGVGITRGRSGSVNLREGVSQTRGATFAEIIDTVGIEDVELR